MTEKEEAEVLFATIEGQIKNKHLKILWNDLWDHLPDYWFTKPASSTGKYHPQFANGHLGLAKHSLYVAMTWEYFWKGLEEVFDYDTIIYECGLIATTFHDAVKYGYQFLYNKYTTKTHPEDAAEWIKDRIDVLESEGVYLDSVSDYIDSYILSAVEHHQGPWSTKGLGQTFYDRIIFLCDYVASQPLFERYPFVPDNFETYKKLFGGEWVDTEEVQKALNIDFSTGFKLFDFSRKAEWNPAPLNGQKITTEFRIKGIKNEDSE